MNTQYFVLVPLGPGPKELLRLKDLLESVSCYQPSNCAGVIVVDDVGQRDNILKAVDFPAEVIVIKNPRNGRGWGWEGGVTTGLLAGYRYVLEKEASYVLRLDTDALVISPFHDRITKAFGQNNLAGMTGAHLKPGENHCGYMASVCGEKLLKVLRPVSIWRNPRLHFRFGWTRGNRTIKRYLQLALKQGYLLGELCPGGGYAMRFESLRRFAAIGVFENPLAFLEGVTEDTLFSLLVKACGLELMDLSGPGEVFSVALGSLRDTPENLAMAGCSIIHSVKDQGDRTEEAIRSFFQNRRLAVQQS